MDRNLELVRKLVQDCGADVNATNEVGTAPLHCISSDATERTSPARVRIQLEIAELLLKAGADANVGTEAGYLDIVKMLVEAGADIHAEAPFTCLTPLDMAKHGKKQDVVDYLITKAAETGERPKRDPPSVEEEDNVSSQKTDTPVEETVGEFEGAVGGFQQLDIKDDDSTDDE
ncbi:hypothetical protein Bbelb_372910 [Branchiostoma belcheri]|nr:hypothetical protein Bbelb_372910 [Branchiostoma belcheri]